MGTKYKKNEKTGLYSTLIWDGTYDADGRKHRKKLTSRKSSADLEKQVAAFKLEVQEKGSVTKVSTTPFLLYAREWLSITKAGKELNTKKMYRYIIDRYFSLIADVPISEIRHSHFQAVINDQLDHPQTCLQIALTFRQIIKYAAKNHHIAPGMVNDIIDDVSIPKCRKPQKRALNAVEKAAIEKADLDPRKRAFLSILYYCGLRRGEAMALTTEDFDWDACTLSVSKVIVFDTNTPVLKPYPKSERGIRTVPIPERAVQYIRPFAEEQDGFLFHGRDREMMSETAFRRMWDSILIGLNMAMGYNPDAKKDRGEKPITELTPHMLRHNYCTELCYQVPAISTKMIARLLGDDERMVLEVYSHIQEEKEDLQSAINKAF
jgi:integrase